jgi:hypothetical protein
MKRLFLVILCAALVGVGLWFSKMPNTKPGILARSKGQKQVSEADVSQKMAKLHIPFISNQGQTDKRVNSMPIHLEEVYS